MVFSIQPEIAFSFTRNIPASLNRYLLPVSSGASAAADENIELLLQESKTCNSQFYHAVYRTNRDTELRIVDDQPFFYIYLALQHDRQLTIKGLGSLLIKEGQYNLIYAPQFDITSLHEAGREYISMSLQFSRDTLQEWAVWFPPLTDFLEKVDAGQPAVLLEGHRWIDRDIQDAIYRLTHISRDMPGYEAYFDLMTRTLLFHLLLQATQQQAPSPYTNYEIAGIHAAREMIQGNIRHHFLIPEIAQKVGVNEFKLKSGFRELFGNGVYEFLRLERMQEARELLSSAKRSIKEVAAKTGYKSVNSFIKAFKKEFGLTPGEYRRSA
jgi:AraC family transcriptional regulator, transcriptional activator of the genes for pyochelin and ferripyochelin receptors